MSKERKENSRIRMSPSTKKRLKSLKRGGESFETLIKRKMLKRKLRK